MTEYSCRSGCGLTTSRAASLVLHERRCVWLIDVDTFVIRAGVIDSQPDNCWLNKRSKPGRYGTYGSDRIHRQAYRVFYQTEPGELLVCHQCDNPPCFNPLHLFLGTWSDNTSDAVRKGRIVSPMKNPATVAKVKMSLPRGDKHYIRKNPEIGRDRVKSMLAARGIDGPKGEL